MDELLALIVGGSVLVLALIVWPVSRRVRAESGMDPELQAVVLLGERLPDDPAPPPAPHRDFDPGEIKALQEIGQPEPQRKRRRSKKK